MSLHSLLHKVTSLLPNIPQKPKKPRKVKVQHIKLDEDNDYSDDDLPAEFYKSYTGNFPKQKRTSRSSSVATFLKNKNSKDDNLTATSSSRDCSFAGFYKTTRLLKEEIKNAKSERFYMEMGYFTDASMQKVKNPIEEEQLIRRSALTSRLIVLFIQILSSSILPKHENDGFKTPKDNLGDNATFLDSFINSTLSGFVNWDGEYFLHIASNGYTHENTIAFFPLFPALVGITSTVLHKLLFPFLSFQSLAQIVSWSLNMWFFQETALALSKLTKFCDRGLHNLDSIVIFLFCYNPASIFFSSFYSESLFACTTVYCLLSLYERNLFNAVFFASLSSICRSNGLLNFGFIAAFVLRDKFSAEAIQHHYHRRVKHLVGAGFSCVWTLFHCALGVVPFVLFQMYCSWQFCGNNRNVYAGEARKLCNLEQLPYTYIQAKNWEVGFLRYFQWAKLPNFLVAAPVLIVMGYESSKRVAFYGKCITKYHIFQALPDLAMGIHGLFLVCLGFLYIHVEVSTRMIMSACPYLYIYIAKSLRTEICQLRARDIDWLFYSSLIHTWFLVYFIGGTLLFSRGYAWT